MQKVASHNAPKFDGSQRFDASLTGVHFINLYQILHKTNHLLIQGFVAVGGSFIAEMP
jgi:hypothetical protein